MRKHRNHSDRLLVRIRRHIIIFCSTNINGWVVRLFLSTISANYKLILVYIKVTQIDLVSHRLVTSLLYTITIVLTCETYKKLLPLEVVSFIPQTNQDCCTLCEK